MQQHRAGTALSALLARGGAACYHGSSSCVTSGRGLASSNDPSLPKLAHPTAEVSIALPARGPDSSPACSSDRHASSSAVGIPIAACSSGIAARPLFSGLLAASCRATGIVLRPTSSSSIGGGSLALWPLAAPPARSRTGVHPDLVRHKGTKTNLEEAAEAAGLAKVAVSEDVLSRVKDHGLLHTAGLIGGKWADVSSDMSTFEVINPATGAVIATMPRMRADETRAAIAAAHAVLPQWRGRPAKERAAVLRRWYELIQEHKADIATLMTLECGKPTAEALGEIASGAASVDWFAGEAVRVCGDVLEPPLTDRRMLVLKQAVGVVGAITPWNFPMSMITRKVAPALAAGCTVVLKPAELTPLTAVALAELAERAGLPDGCLNIVMGDAAAIGHELVSSDTVRKLGFTGSTAVGRLLAAGAGQAIKRISLELGGNAPIIVFEDADLELAAKGVVGSALRNAGQTCICANRIFVHEKVYDQLADAVVALTQRLQVGDGSEAGVTVGPLITAAALNKVTGHVADAVAKGGKLLAGGGRPELPAQLAGGNFFEPTVIGDATIDMRCFKEETFGPLIPLFRFSSDEEAVLLANTTEYGLAAYFYTRDLARAWRVAEELEFGMVGLNEVAITSEAAPFGGVKASGLGREQSKYGLAEFLDIKYVCMGLGYSPA